MSELKFLDSCIMYCYNRVYGIDPIRDEAYLKVGLMLEEIKKEKYERMV